MSRSEDAPKGFGKTILEHAIDVIEEANLLVGCRLVRVDCVDKLICYYEDKGFRFIRKNADGDLNQMAYVLKKRGI